jgi:hypothetical protein
MSGRPLDMEALIKAIAAKFKQYDMQGHLRLLRAYYRERRRRRLALWSGSGERPWNEDMVLNWAVLWRVPPFEHAIQIKPERSPCACGEGREAHAHANVFSGTVFPEGRVVHCCRCDAFWLELDGDLVERAPR